jgi:hypothetical protein
MKRALALGLMFSLAAVACAAAADGYQPPQAHHQTSATRSPVPLALRTLSRRSASVIASAPCWRYCTTQCSGGFHGCLRVDSLDNCIAANNACELFCVRVCRPIGGPLLDLTNY